MSMAASGEDSDGQGGHEIGNTTIKGIMQHKQ
jgi:hypothetical protein